MASRCLCELDVSSSFSDETSLLVIVSRRALSLTVSRADCEPLRGAARGEATVVDCRKLDDCMGDEAGPAPQRHLGKLDLLGGSLVCLVVALVAQVAAVVLFHLFPPPPPLRGIAGPSRICPARTESPPILGLVFKRQARQPRGLEVLGCDGGGNRRRMHSLD